MNTVNYQPTGVYQQFVKNPGLLDTPANTEEKPKKVRKKMIAACAAAAGIGAMALYYKKGTGAIKLKNDTFGKAENFETFIQQKGCSENEIVYLKDIWDKGVKHYNGIVGMINRALGYLSDFFKRNFYNY